MATRTQEALSAESMRRAVAQALGEDPRSIGEEEDLVRRGIDSIRVMRLASGWRRSGVDLTFAELIERPTLRAWWALASARADARPATPEPAEIDEGAPFELAPMQRAYWIGRDDDQILGGVGAHFYAEFDGEGVNPELLDAALRALLARHAMLRARVSEDGRQQIMAESPWRGVTVHDFAELGAEQAAAASARLREALAGRRLDVERGEVFDVQLTLCPGGATRLHVSIDMLVCDAQSFQVILGDLARLYLRPEAELGPIRYSFARYLAERSRGRGEAHEAALAYWRGLLDELPGAPQLPLAVAPERLARHGTGRRFHWMPPGRRRRIEQRCRDHALTLPAVLATAFCEVLATWSSEPRFLLNLPLFDREDLHPDVGRLVGDFSNLLILAVDVGEDLPFAQQVRGLHSRLAAAAAHAEYSGVEVLRDLARARPGGAMLAPVVFTSVVGMGELFGPEVRRCFGTPAWTSSQTPQVWLDHQVTEHDGGLLFNWDVVEELFEAGVVDAMFDAERHLLDWLGDPAGSWNVPSPPLLPPAQAAVREAVNATGAPLPEGLLHGGFFARAAAAPDAVAVAWGDEDRLTYAELRDRSLRIGALLERRGVRPGDAVAVTLPRGPDQIAAVLGVLAAGATYVPVGPDQPPRRRADVYASARAAVVLTDSTAAPELTGGVEAVPVHDARGVAPLTAPVSVPPESLAYVIFTSGSTGAPKGVEIAHRAALNTIEDVNTRFGVGPCDAVLGVSALDFDLSVYDIFGLLSAGGTVVVPDEADRREARRWAELVRRWKVSIWNSVPALLDMLLVAAGTEGLGTSLRLALVSGDWVGLDLPPSLAAACPAARFVALGGATEAAIWSNFFEVEAVPSHWRSIPYGRPLRNQAYRVADLRGRDCPDWVPGELWIGGAGLAEGYRGDPTRTAERFVLHEGGRWYRTGDLGRYWPDATLEFLGRKDLQVKIRGHRVELGEVEAALRSHPDVGGAAAAVTGGLARRIVAAVVPRAGGVEQEHLQSFLAERLPPYLLPAGLTVLDELPLSPNGKVDRAALARLIEVQEPEPGDEPPRGPIEASLARIWSELLGVTEVPRNRSFFALGGDSLVATRLVESLRDRFGVGVSLRRLFEAPTVAELGAVVASRCRELEEAEEGVV